MRASPNPRRLFVAAALLAALGCEDMRAQQLLRTATELGARGHWPEAVHYYERLIVQFPGSAWTDEARLQAARIYAGPENKPRSAEDLYRQLVIDGRDSSARAVAVLELIRLVAAGEGGAEKASEILELYRQRSPDPAGLRAAALTLADIDLDRGMLFQAVQESEAFVDDRDPGVRARARLIVAQAQELSRNPLAARERYAAARQDAPVGSADWVAAVEGLARTYEVRGELAETEAALAELEAHHPNPEAIARWRRAVGERRQEMNR